jgi:hypothetical protein
MDRKLVESHSRSERGGEDDDDDDDNNNNNSIHLFTCLTTAKYGQLQPSTKTTVQVNIIKQTKT